MTHLESALAEPIPDLIRVLPQNVADPFGRPILLLKISTLNAGIPENFKLQLVRAMDSLLQHAGKLNKDGRTPPVFQYVILADLSDVSSSGMVCLRTIW